MLPGKYIIDEFFDEKDINVCNMKCDVYEKDNNYYIDLDVPGYKKDSLKVEYNGGYITIIGTKKEEVEDKGKKYIKRERNYGVYKRQFYVGDIDASKINAKYKDGILSLIVPKTVTLDNTKIITIK